MNTSPAQEKTHIQAAEQPAREERTVFLQILGNKYTPSVTQESIDKTAGVRFLSHRCQDVRLALIHSNISSPLAWKMLNKPPPHFRFHQQFPPHAILVARHPLIFPTLTISVVHIQREMSISPRFSSMWNSFFYLKTLLKRKPSY